jgi:hypothetical protein
MSRQELELRAQLTLGQMQDSAQFFSYLADKLSLPGHLVFHHPGHGLHTFPGSRSPTHHNMLPGVLDLSDKARFSRLYQGPGVPISVVLSEKERADPQCEIPLPCLAKPPRQGSGQGIVVVRSREDLHGLRGTRVFSQYVENPLLHEVAHATRWRFSDSAAGCSRGVSH